MYKRLETIATMVPKGCILADIGTDHAQLPIMLVKNGVCEKIYACDEKKGPLAIAKENIAKENLSDKIETILSDGFSNIPMDINVAVIAGMGYYTAEMILENAKNRLDLLDRIIVQINLDSPYMRKWISDHHYKIYDEKYISERNKDYEIISFSTKETQKELTEEEIFLGPILMNEHSHELEKYYKKRETKLFDLLKLKSKDDISYEITSKQYRILNEYNKKTW